MRVSHDLHAHTTYSDGWDLEEMAAAAERSGLDAIGFADHCPIGPDPFGRREQYDLRDTYERRRHDLQAASERCGVRCIDAAEVNYDPRVEDAIVAFLETAGFTYTIGSIHFVDGYDVMHPDLSEASKEERRDVVQTYLDWQVALIESEIFDVVGHLDVVQRVPALRGVMEASDYRRLADALATSRTVPELNAGRLDRAYGRIHPDPDHLEPFARRNVSFVVGTDAHAPEQIERRVDLLPERLDSLPVEIRELPPSIA